MRVVLFALACAIATTTLAVPFHSSSPERRDGAPLVGRHVRFDIAPHRVNAAVTLSGRPHTHFFGNDTAAMLKFVADVDAPAWGWFQDDVSATGWASLEVRSNENASDEEQAYAAGYLEGAISHSRIHDYLHNAPNIDRYSADLKAYIVTNNEWVANETRSKGGSDGYWYQVGLLYRQFDGLYDGYTSEATESHNHSKKHIYALTMMGDLDDLCPALGCKVGPPPLWNTRRASAAAKMLVRTDGDGGMMGRPAPSAGESEPEPVVRRGDDHCSALIKVLRTGDGAVADVIAGHVTWGGLESMLRVYKHYDFPWSRSGRGSGMVPARRIAFSSYPGVLFSDDDYYQTSANLVVTETTLGNFNATLWAQVQPTGQVLDWARTMLATRMAANGDDWTSLYARYNSGTYNNQWMVVDYNVVNDVVDRRTAAAGTGGAAGLLWILEQMPGLVQRADVTPTLLADDHWASYNRPYFPSIFEISGQGAQVAKFGPHFSYNETARALLFRLLAPTVVDAPSFERVMRHNDFMNDPEEIAGQGCTFGRSASNAIAERGDLTPSTARCIDDVLQMDSAGIDCKYTSRAGMLQTSRAGDAGDAHGGRRDGQGLRVSAISGPTYDSVPVFQWSSSPFVNVSHRGLPDRYDFPWVDYEWDAQPQPVGTGTV